MTLLVDQISGPQDLKKLSITELKQVASEMRQLILERDAAIGGHLSPNLATVELTIAFHYIFDSPVDKIIWDVSHQSYGHKILTGRRSGFAEGHYHDFSGYTNQKESEHDFFTIGHTSTSIALAAGMVQARDLKGDKGNIVAFIGDGAMSGGQAFEGLNNVGRMKTGVIVVVNDNEWAIDENQGSLYTHLADLRASNGQSENNLFKAMGFDYRYVEEGNDLEAVIAMYRAAKDSDHPILLHVHTKKGKGYEVAEKAPMMYHQPTAFDIESGEIAPIPSGENYVSVMQEVLDERIAAGEPIMAINAAIPFLFGLKEFQGKYPDRYVDAGIAEQYTVTWAAGMASNGARPVVFHASTFLERAYDQLLHDIALNNVPAVIIVRGGSINPADATHQGSFDLAFTSTIPNFKIFAPATAEDLRAVMTWSLTQKDHPVMIRIPEQALLHGEAIATDFSQARYQVLEQGRDVAILALGGFASLGRATYDALKAKGISASLINPVFTTDLDEAQLEALKADHKLVITLEDGSLRGGFGEMIARYYGPSDMKVMAFGGQKEFTDRESYDSLYDRYHLTPEHILDDIAGLI